VVHPPLVVLARPQDRLPDRVRPQGAAERLLTLQVPQWLLPKPPTAARDDDLLWRLCAENRLARRLLYPPSDGNDAVERKTEVMNRTLKSLALSLSLLLPAGAFAASPDGAPKAGEHRGHHRGGFFFIQKIERHASELGIPQTTVDKMKATVESARPDFERLRGDLRAAHKEGDLTKISAAETALLNHRQALRAQLDGMLNAQQKAAIKQMMERHRAERGEKAGG
jgi:hypothetical protein